MNDDQDRSKNDFVPTRSENLHELHSSLSKRKHERKTKNDSDTAQPEDSQRPSISRAGRVLQPVPREIWYSKIKSIAKIQAILDLVPKRVILGIMVFLSTSVYYMMYTSFNVLLLVMVVNNDTEKEVKDYGTRYSWDDSKQLQALCAFHIGECISVVPGSILVELVGQRYIVGCGLSLAGLFSFLLPVAASVSGDFMNTCRVLQGFCCGSIIPAIHFNYSRWVIPYEKSKFLWTLLGSMIGTAYTFVLCDGLVVAFQRYDVAFYIIGSIAIAWGLIWFFMVANIPRQHSRISEKELNYICQYVDFLIEPKFHFINISSLVTSRRFWALFCLHSSQYNGEFILITIAPKYFDYALGSELKTWQEVVPNMCRLLFALGCCIVADLLHKREDFSTAKVRKIFVVFSHFIPGALLFALMFSGDGSYAVYSLIIGFMGAATVTNITNIHDLAPNHAAQLSGILMSVSLFLSVSCRFIIAELLKKVNLSDAWKVIFFIPGALLILGGIVFFVIGTGKLQSWNFQRNSLQYAVFNVLENSQDPVQARQSTANGLNDSH